MPATGSADGVKGEHGQRHALSCHRGGGGSAAHMTVISVDRLVSACTDETLYTMVAARDLCKVKPG